MSRISDRFSQLKQKGEKALITFITAGDPDLKTTEECIFSLEEGGADIIELGVPFSDPMADGPTIQKSSERALAAGTSLADIFECVRAVRQRSSVPIVLMGYYNPVFRYGAARFSADAADAGVDGVLLVDLPPEESGEFAAAAGAAKLDLISLLTPTSDAARIEKATRAGRGFIYYVSVTGVTGARASVADSLADKVDAVRKSTALPVAVGFGISTADQAEQVARTADGVVVGSAIVKLFEEFTGNELKDRVRKFAADLKAGVRRAR